LSDREIKKREIDKLKNIEIEKIKNAQLEKEKEKEAKHREIAKLVAEIEIYSRFVFLTPCVCIFKL
jgi:hypothetical protein